MTGVVMGGEKRRKRAEGETERGGGSGGDNEK